ncbi:nuclear transport factor 2 family protein [Microbulbifer spongiae]|uniref:Nuclear transport factor 2 family protein n=1 Tax=Microbulbifer spongiae TaxID=2944933 RepID=A0ABY9EE74_9GAMM|nr:nuclear transport factor 2 family protein [Microbulbifer sp. MI-G]WKD50770.1 nuclear transport factor 2 family protein [Microbulbifer sp. MI-G]
MMRALSLALLLVLATAPTQAGDQEKLKQLLIHFLNNAASNAEVHRRFWAKDLIYTSSAGKRFGKHQIMQGLENPGSEPASVRYTAEDIDIRLLGDTAIVAFKLLADDSTSGEANHYFNTGTFVKQQGEWRALAWQATKIPHID